MAMPACRGDNFPIPSLYGKTGTKAMTTLRIAPVEETDAGQLLAIYTPYVAGTAVTFECEAPTPDEFAGRIRDVRQFHPYLKCMDGKTIIGYGYAHRWMERKAYQWTAELSVYVRGDRVGGGIGRALYHALIELSRRQHLHTLIGCLGLPNDASEKLHRHFGFTRFGYLEKAGYKFGRWWDVAWYGKRIAEGEPLEPRPFSALPAEEVARVMAESRALLDGK